MPKEHIIDGLTTTKGKVDKKPRTGYPSGVDLNYHTRGITPMFYIPHKYILIALTIVVFIYLIHLIAKFVGFNQTGHEP
jgi:hypothetical protein